MTTHLTACRKRRYPTEQAAYEALQRVWERARAFRDSLRHRRERRVFHCPTCAAWHLTSGRAKSC